MTTFDVDAELITLAQLKAWNGLEEVSLYLGSRYYEAGGIEYDDRLISPLIVESSFAGAFSNRGRAAVSALTISNEDRALDGWLDYAWAGRDATLLIGHPTEDLSEFKVLFDGIANRIEANDAAVTLFLRDLFEALDQRIVQRPLNVHPQAAITPYPLAIGAPNNVTPVPFNIQPGYTSFPNADFYLLNAWAINALVSVTPYENGLETVKTYFGFRHLGGGAAGILFDPNAPEGRVTCDVFLGAMEDPASTDVGVPGERGELKYAADTIGTVLTWESNIEAGICPQDGDTETVYLESNASDQDDHYNAVLSSPIEISDVGLMFVYRRNLVDSDWTVVDDYDGPERRVDLTTRALSFTPVAGDAYQIVPPAYIRNGPLTDAQVNSSALAALPEYHLGIWDPGGELTYLALLDGMFPGGFWYGFDAGIFTCGLLEAPAEEAVAEIDLDETHGVIRVVQDIEPIYRARVGYDKNWTVMTNPDSSVTPERASFLAREYLWEVAQDLTVLDAYPEARSIDYPSWLKEKGDAKTEADRLLALFGVPSKRYLVECFALPFSFGLHDTVKLIDRAHGLQGGVNLRVVAKTERPLEGKVDLELWGPYTLAANRTLAVSGAVQSGLARVTGAVELTSVSGFTGAVQAGNATVAGSVEVDLAASGAVQSQAAAVAGGVDVALAASGAVQSQAASVAGDVAEPAAGVSIVAASTDSVIGSGSSPATSHVLDGGGTNRCVVAVISGSRGGPRTLTDVQLDGVSGTIINQVTADGGGGAAMLAFAYWLDTDHPDAGTFTVESFWDGQTNDVFHTVIELSGVAQTGTFGTPGTDSATDTDGDALSLSVSVTGETGELAIVGLTGGDDGGATSFDNTSVSASNIDNEHNNSAGEETLHGVWTDEVVAGSPQAYAITGAGSDLIQAWAAMAVSVRAA